MSEPRICIVGAGGLSSSRIYPYIGTAGGQLVGVCDLDAEKAGHNARLWGGTAYCDMDAMLDAEQPDGVIICIGPAQHAELAPVVMRRGIPVYTEKPPATSAADALAVARVAKETGLLCTTAFKKRYAACYSRAKDWLSTFSADKLASLSIDYASARYDNADPRCEFLLDFAIHGIDLVGYLFGDVAQVVAFTKDHHSYAVGLRYANGAVGTMNLTDGRAWDVPTEEVEITVDGGNFMTIHNSSTWRITQDYKPCEWREPATFVSSGDGGNDTGHLPEIIEFIEAVKSGGSTRSNIYESYKSMVLYEAIRDSAASGRTVNIVYDQC